MSRWWARHLAALAFFGFMAVLHTWPLASAPGALSRHDNGDALLNEWIVAWVEHQIVRDPVHLFDANIFYPERNTLAFSEHLFVQSVVGLPLHWAGLSTTAVHNLVLIIGLALSGYATSVVMFRWTGDAAASVLSGCLMAFNAFTLTNLAHLQAMHVEFLPVAVLALHELLERPRVSAAVGLAIFFVLQGLTSNYLLVFTLCALAAALLVRPDGWWGSRAGRLAGPLSLAVALGALSMTPFLLPYYWASQQHPELRRTAAEMAMYAASWRDYLSTGGRLHFDSWSARFWTGAALFPGVVAAALALTSLASGVAWRDRRARMWLAIGVVGVLLSLGPALPGHGVLTRVLPLLQGLRASGRFGFLMLTAVAVLGGFGLTWWRQRFAGRPRVGLALAVTAVALVTAEAIRAPLWYSAPLPVPAIYGVLAREPTAVVVEYPPAAPPDAFMNAPYLLYSTRHWKPMVNGYSGFVPASYRRTWERIHQFPGRPAMAALVEMGVTHVVVHGPANILAADQAPGLTRLMSTPEVAIYRLDGKHVDSRR